MTEFTLMPARIGLALLGHSVALSRAMAAVFTGRAR
jgi:hypothetical protein